jgi:signal transduction histidine kinase
MPLRLRETDLATLVAETAARLPRDPQQQITLSLSNDLAPTLLDPDRIEQIVSNLLDNAAKYSPEHGEITVTLARETGGVQLCVRDQGIGLPPGSAEHVFQPFGRAPNAQAANIPGLGLGLYISRQIAEQHGGRLWAESAGEGLGTTLCLWLPCVPVDIPDTAGAAHA